MVGSWMEAAYVMRRIDFYRLWMKKKALSICKAYSYLSFAIVAHP